MFKYCSINSFRCLPSLPVSPENGTAMVAEGLVNDDSRPDVSSPAVEYTPVVVVVVKGSKYITQKMLTFKTYKMQ